MKQGDRAKCCEESARCIHWEEGPPPGSFVIQMGGSGHKEVKFCPFCGVHLECHHSDQPGKFGWIIDRLKRQTPEQARQRLVDAGLLDPDGELADEYCSKKQLKEKKARRKAG